MRTIKFDDNGLTKECPAIFCGVTSEDCRKCPHNKGFDGFDANCDYVKKESWHIRFGEWMKKYKLRIGMAEIFVAGLWVGLLPSLALPVWGLAMLILTSTIFIIEGRNDVLDHISALEKQLKVKK